MNIRRLKYLLLIIVLAMSASSYGQFYRGSQMTFGKNRVQYNDFYWSFYRFENFDVYFNEYGRDLAEYTGKYAHKQLSEMENFIDHRLNKRLVLLVYNKLSDFRQSNIGLVTGNEEYNLGGISTVVENKVFLYYEGDHRKFDHQVKKAVAYSLVNEMLLDNPNRARVRNSSKMEYPEWYFEGLTSYLSNNWDFEIENEVKDGILSGKYKKLNRLEKEDAATAGHSFWKFIADTYGENIIPNVLYITRINNDYNKGLYYVLGVSMKELNEAWLDYFKEKFTEDEQVRFTPEAKKIIEKPKKETVYEKLKVSPDGRNVAYVTNKMGRYKVWILDTYTGKKKWIYRREPKVEQIIDYSYPVMAWHPTGKMLTIITEEKGGLDLLFYRTATKKIERKNLLYFDKIIDFSYSPNGGKLVFSAMKNGLTDLFLYDIAAGTHEQLTYDLADDLSPRYSKLGDHIIFSSNRINDTLTFGREYDKEVGMNFDLFLYDIKSHSPYLTRLAEDKYIDKFNAFNIKDNEYLYLGDQSGILNRYYSRFDSAISYIDTTIHYRYFAESKPITNYNRNILEEDFSPYSETFGEVVLEDGKYNMYFGQLFPEDLDYVDKPIETVFRKKHTDELVKLDSIEVLRQRLIEEDRRMRDTLTKPLYAYFETETLVDVNNYVFEEEKENYYKHLLKKDLIEIDLDTADIPLPPIRIYETSFYTNYLATQLDFGYLNNFYQAFNGSGVYYNPGIGMLFNIGANDLFEDYKIVGGFRFSADFNSNEYLVSFESLKKRIDKQIVFHRQSYKSYVGNSSNWVKVHSNQLLYAMTYPINQVMAVKGTVGLRSDREVFQATNRENLFRDDRYATWANFKLEYIYDNTRYRGVNLYNGVRFKIFGEYYQRLEQRQSDVFIVGGDFRYYIKIHRDLIWANRFAASTSFGHNKLIYYMGGVDNWFNIFNVDEMFDQSIPIDYTQNYVFQTVATNMRGFKQNVRNGNTFALINSEIRWPIIRYLANRPISSKVLNNFQIVGFADIGTAWTGWDPYSGENSYDKDEIKNGPVTVTVQSNREPVIAGYGFGLRSVVFGYFIRLDWAWGVENFVTQPMMFYLSLSLDF
ncbi:MAG: hypothetical protein QNK30_02410 [Bacteroidales bacterium]|nr:hypothetical protein [Bacteroidales bacterium]